MKFIDPTGKEIIKGLGPKTGYAKKDYEVIEAKRRLGYNNDMIYIYAHASQYDQGKIKFVEGSTNIARGGSLSLTQAEIGSYMIQYSINKGTMPKSTGGRLKSIFSITDKWLRGVNDGKGYFPYQNHY